MYFKKENSDSGSLWRPGFFDIEKRKSLKEPNLGAFSVWVCASRTRLNAAQHHDASGAEPCAVRPPRLGTGGSGGPAPERALPSQPTRWPGARALAARRHCWPCGHTWRLAAPAHTRSRAASPRRRCEEPAKRQTLLPRGPQHRHQSPRAPRR